MKLTHLGDQYNRFTPDIETVETETDLCFLGRTFNRLTAKAAPPKFPGDDLTYRGVNYKA